MSKKPLSATEGELLEPLVVTDAHHAPVIYFDGSPNFGNNNDIINVTFVVLKHTLNAGDIVSEVSVAAYLKCNTQAAIELRNVLDKALLIGATSQQQGAAN